MFHANNTTQLPTLGRSPIQNSSFNQTNQPQRISSSGPLRTSSKALKLTPNQAFLNFSNGAQSSLVRPQIAAPQCYQPKDAYPGQTMLKVNPQSMQYFNQPMMGQTALPPFQASYQEMKLNKTDYQDNFTTSNRMTYDFIKNSSTVAARQVLALNNKICSRTPSNYVHPLQFTAQQQFRQKEVLKQEQHQARLMVEEELLGKYRRQPQTIETPVQFTQSNNTGSTAVMSTRPKLVQNNQPNLKQQLLEAANGYKKMVNLTEDSPNNDDQLRFDDESSSVELDFDINNTDFIFKDQLIKHANALNPKIIPAPVLKQQVVEIQDNKENSSSIVEINEDELEIESAHLQSDSSSPSKIDPSELFKQRNGLNYGQDVKNIQNAFYSKYFKNTTSPDKPTQFKSLSKQNSFLLKQNRVLPLPTKDVEDYPQIKQNNFKVPVDHGNKALYIDKSMDLSECKKLIKRKNFQAIKDNEIKKKQEEEKIKKQKEIQRKRKAIQKKQEQDKVLNELFNYDMNDDDDNNNKNKGGLGGLLEEDSSSQTDEKPTDEDMEIDMDDAQKEGIQIAIRNNEEQAELIRQRVLFEQQREFEEKMRLVRFKNRWNVDELIQPILNLEIIDMYMDEASNQSAGMFPVLPIRFESSSQYFDLWHKLFLYETYNQLINQRNESDKDKEIAKMFGFKLKNDNSNKNFKGLLQKYKSDSKFIYLKLSENDNNNGKTSNEVTGNFNTPYPNLDSLKEFDLLLLSKEELETNNVKQLTSTKFLKDVQSKQGMMMAIVDCKRKSDKNYLLIRVDAIHDKYINLTCSEYDYHQMYVYYFDSMSTRIREFRTVKSVEFYPNADYILDPSSIPKRVLSDQVSENSKNSGKKSGSSICQSRLLMQDFVSEHSQKFNESQVKALKDVSNMNEVDFLLIQGPPGTGKTHTIKGIISMLNAAIQNNHKILVCAPSNAAIDEIVTRLISKGGLFGQNEYESIRKVVRIGAIDYEPSKIVQQVMIGTKMAKGASQNETAQEKEILNAQKLRWVKEIEIVDNLVNLISSAKGIVHQTSKDIKGLAENILADKNQIATFMKYDKDKKIQKIKAYQTMVRQKLRLQEEQRRSNGSNMTRTQRIQLEKKIIEHSQIICTTLAMATNEKLDNLQLGDIDYLIVDEACQSVELNNLIPFEHQPKKVILVGDQQQLPATTFSENAERTKYSRSMFERFLECGVERVMLEIQYRMHPSIREFPSNQFYENRLSDAPSISTRSDDVYFKKSNLSLIQQEFQPIKFFDLTYSVEDSSETSKINNDEVDFIEQLIKRFVIRVARNNLLNSDNLFVKNFAKKELNSEHRRQAMTDLKGLIGIISPYKSQVRQIKDKVYRLLRQFCDIQSPQEFVEINTVDAFQGREKDIIIFSCVRSSKDRQLGFVSDYRRMNVAITRARHCLYVVGNSNTLTRDNNWRSFIDFCRRKGPDSFAEFKSKEQIQVKSLPIRQEPSASTFNDQSNKGMRSHTDVRLKEHQQSSISRKKENQLKNVVSASNLGLAGLVEEEEEGQIISQSNQHNNEAATPKAEYDKPIQERQSEQKHRASSVDAHPNSQSKTVNQSEMKSNKGDETNPKSHGRSHGASYKRDRKDGSYPPSISNQSSSYQSYKPSMNYSKSGENRKIEMVNSASSNKFQGSNQRHYGRNDRDNQFASRFNNDNNRNYHSKNQDSGGPKNYRPNDRFTYFKNQDSYKKENRTNNHNYNRRDGIANNEMHQKSFHAHHDRSKSRERPFFKKRDQKEMHKNQGGFKHNNHFNNKRQRY